MWGNSAFLINSVAMGIVASVLTYRLVSLPPTAPVLLRFLTALVIFAAVANCLAPYTTVWGVPVYTERTVPWTEGLFNISLCPLLLYLLRYPLRSWE